MYTLGVVPGVVDVAGAEEVDAVGGPLGPAHNAD